MRKKRGTDMNNSVRFVDWESRFFGFPVGRIELPAEFSEQELNEVIQEAERKYRLIEIIFRGNGADTLQTGEVSCVCYDRHYLLKKPVPNNVPQLDPHIKVYSSGLCSRQLERLAVQSESLIRIKRDPELSPYYERLFLTWINRSVSGVLADSIWTWKEDGKHIGLVTIRKIVSANQTYGEPKFEGRIGMLAVEGEFRGRSIGKQMFTACDFWCSSLDIPTVSLIIQKENKQTISICEKIGYEKANEVTIYHYWSPGWIYDTRRGWIHHAVVKV
jgi:ribosomal protein S18 acetylase RimI-like enzyme